VIEKPPWRLDQTHSRTGPWRLSDRFFIDYSYGFQNIDSVVNALQDLDRLRQVVVIDVV